MRKLCSMFLAVLMCGCRLPIKDVASSFVYRDAHTSAVPAPHTDLMFSELEDTVPNVTLEIARVEELRFRIERGELSGTRAKTQLDRHRETWREIETAAALAYVRYCKNVNDEPRKQANDLLTVQTETLHALLIRTELLLTSDPALSYDSETIAALQRAASLYDPALEPLRKEERELVGAYEAAAQNFTIEAYGRTWTKEQILTDPTLTYDSFKPLYEAYLSAYNKAVGSYYIKLIDVRNRIAASSGYPSYAEYAYARYGRDYSTDETAAMSEAVKTAFVPLLIALQPAFFDAQMRLSCGTFKKDATMARVKETLLTILPEFSEPWTYMTSHGMYDFGISETRMQGSFTTYFPAYGAPFLFSSWDDSYAMPSTLLHECGHYASFFWNGENAADALDLAEVDSQGLELLTLPAYDRLYGALADAAETANLFYALYIVLDGCMEDAFQQYAYHTKNVTLDMLNAEYGRLCRAYGLYDLGLDALAWTEVPHTFQSPMYYISYSTGMLAALGLFALQQKNRTAAVEAYRSILHRKAQTNFRDAVVRVGLLDPFDPQAIEQSASVIRKITTLKGNDM